MILLILLFNHHLLRLPRLILRLIRCHKCPHKQRMLLLWVEIRSLIYLWRIPTICCHLILQYEQTLSGGVVEVMVIVVMVLGELQR